MLNFETIKGYFDKGFWSADMVGNAVKKGKISPEQYAEITGAEYAQ